MSDENLRIRQILFQQFRQLIQSKWTGSVYILDDLDEMFLKLDCQINLYGSILFNCCLDKPGTMDIDVYSKDISSFETLKQIVDHLVKRTGR